MSQVLATRSREFLSIPPDLHLRVNCQRLRSNGTLTLADLEVSVKCPHSRNLCHETHHACCLSDRCTHSIRFARAVHYTISNKYRRTQYCRPTSQRNWRICHSTWPFCQCEWLSHNRHRPGRKSIQRLGAKSVRIDRSRRWRLRKR